MDTITHAIRVDIDPITDIREPRERVVPNTIKRSDIVRITPIIGWGMCTHQIDVLDEWGYGDLDHYHVQLSPRD